MFRPLVAAAVLSVSAGVGAQTQINQQRQAETGQPPQRIRSVTLTGTQKCPASTATEVVVCSRIDPNEQFRVPKELRQPVEIPAQNQSWVNRASTVDRTARVAAGLPNTCSAVGTGGQSGCAIMQAGDWAAARAAARREDAMAAPSSDPED